VVGSTEDSTEDELVGSIKLEVVVVDSLEADVVEAAEGSTEVEIVGSIDVEVVGSADGSTEAEAVGSIKVGVVRLVRGRPR
jgi:hypothetical protein